MRLVELRAGGVTLVPHRRLTVITGLDAGTHDRVVDALAGLGRGQLPGHVSGLLEAHGVQFDLTPTTVAALGLPADLDAVLRAGDLPGGSVPLEAVKERVERAREEAERRQAVVEAAREQLRAVSTDEGARARRATLADDLERRQAELEQLSAAVEEARSESGGVWLTPEDLAAVEAAHEAVVDAEARVERSRIPNPAARRRLRVAEQAEQEVLGRLGLTSYGAYLLRTSTMHIDADAAKALGELDDRRRDAEKALVETRDALAAADARLAESGVAEAAAAAAVESAERAARDAANALSALEARLAAAERPAAVDGPGDDGDAEVYVLARLAGVRAGGCAGSVPMAVDDAVSAMPPPARRRLLDLLDRMSVAVQILYLSDDDDVSEWAAALGRDRADVLRVEGS